MTTIVPPPSPIFVFSPEYNDVVVFVLSKNILLLATLSADIDHSSKVMQACSRNFPIKLQIKVLGVKVNVVLRYIVRESIKCI